MATPTFTSKSAALLLLTLVLLTLGTRTALAQEGLTYATITDGASATVSAANSLNPFGGPITASRTSTGLYVVTFPNSGIGAGWVALAAAYGPSSNYCNIMSWGSSTVTVQCYNPSGAAADSPFTVLALAGATAALGPDNRGIDFAWANQPTATAEYSPDPSYSYNPEGAISILRQSIGSYVVTFVSSSGNFAGVSGDGTVQVSTSGGNQTCYVPAFRVGITVDVTCVDANGNPADAPFVIADVPNNFIDPGLAYMLNGAADPSSAYNPTGGGVDVAYPSTGHYLVTFGDLDVAQVSGGFVRAIAYNAAARCNVESWSPAPGSGFQAVVDCYDFSGNPQYSDFLLLALPPMGYAYAQVDPLGNVSAANSMNPGAAAVTAVHLSTGSYSVTFPNSGIGDGWAVQVTAYGPKYYGWCWATGWSGGTVNVQCLTVVGGGALFDSPFTVTAFSNTNGQNMAFALTSSPSSPISGADPAHSYNPGGQIYIQRTAVGQYQVVFPGLDVADGGNLQVQAYNTDGHCYPIAWAIPVQVFCTNAGGGAADLNFVIFAIPAGTSPPTLAWAWADQDTAGSYTPNPAYSYNPGGAITVTRSSPGSYVMTFAGFNPAQLLGGNVLVTASESTNTWCIVQSSVQSPAGLAVTVACDGDADGGVPADSNYRVLVFAPLTGIPAVVAPVGGTPQSAVVSTSFATPLAALVIDGNGDPISGIGVTFTAPGSGAGGTFPGLSLSATAATNSSGVATAPAFTANATTGTYSVTASVLGVADTARFSLTNNPVVDYPVTLQTSPANLLVSLNGGGFAAAPVTAQFAAGSNLSIATETPQAGGAGVQYVWQNWSDSGAISHGITVPSSSATYTANFQTQYQLTIAASPSGGGAVTPASGGFFNPATAVPVSATANTGYTFAGWSGPVASASSASTTVTMNAPETVTANFSSLTGITIQTNPPGLQFSVDGGPPQTAPQTLNLSQTNHTIAVATTQTGAGTQNLFTAWSDGGAASHTITVTGAAATYTASFQTQYQLTISALPAAGGSVTPSSGTFYNAAAVVPITATANAGYTFTGWSGSVASPSIASTTATMSAPETVTANFSSLTGITIQTNPTGLQFNVDGGAVQTAPQILNLAPGSHTIAVITTQTGAPGTQYLFNGWSDSGAASHAINVTGSPATYTASFTTQYFLLSAVSPAGAGSVAANPAAAGFYNAGTSVQLTASANPGFTFTGWSGDLGGSANPQFLVMNAIHNVTANFAPGSSACSFVLGSSSANLPPTGTSAMETCPNGSGQANCGVLPETPQSFTVTPSAACGPWTATSSNPEFLQLAAGGFSGNGAGAVAYTLLNNTHTLPQTYTITVASGGASAAYTVNQAGSGDSQVYREIYALYEQLLGRDPDAAGFAFWTGSGSAGLGQMADSFLTSPEAFNSDFAVMAAYQASTGAPPTYAQFTAAVASIRAGTQTVPGLFNSLLTPGYSPATLYQNLLNRAPSAGDSSCTSMSLANCFQSIVGFPASATPVGSTNNEFQSTGIYHTTPSADHTNALYVQMIYYVTVSRDPDAGGLSFWTGVANSGGPGVLFQGSAGYSTRIQILGPGTPNQGFIGSPEFQGLFAN